MKLHYEYFCGQVFDLDQKTMNRMIEDVHALLSELNEQARVNGMGSEREARLMAELVEAHKAHDASEAELAEYKSLHAQVSKLVMPGEMDSGDAYMKLLRDLRAELEEVKRDNAEYEQESVDLAGVYLPTHRQRRELEQRQAPRREGGVVSVLFAFLWATGALVSLVLVLALVDILACLRRP